MGRAGTESELDQIRGRFAKKEGAVLAGSFAFEKEEHRIFRESVRRFLEKEARPHYESWEEHRIIPRSFWRKMGDQGFLCPQVEEKYGGAGVDFGFSAILQEELEKVGSGMIGIGLHNDIVVPYLTAYGTEEQKGKYLPRCVTGEIITAVAMTEPGSGSDLAAMQTTATRAGDVYVVNGQKTFITNGIQGDLLVVACKTDSSAQPPHKGISLLLIEKDTIGFTRGRKLNKVGLHCQDTAELFFADAKVPVGNLLGVEGKGYYYLMEKLQQERLVVSICAQVAAEEMWSMTANYVKGRKAFGQTLNAFQHIRFTLAEMATEIELGRTFLDDLIYRHMENQELVTRVSMAKWWITDMARRVAAKCMQLHGGYGYMEEYPIARRFRDTPVMSIYAGSNEMMKIIIAKKMGL